MARVEFDESFGIKNLSGAFRRQRLKDGRVVVTFFTKKGRLYTREYKRSTPISEKEKSSRSNFAIIASEVARRIRNGDHRGKSVLWDEVKKELAAGVLS